jgi:aldehyde dehydrogenase (NAD+)
MTTNPEIETRLFIDGEFVPSLDGAKFTVTNPFSGEVVAEVYEAKANDVDKAVESAKKAFPAWSELDGSAILFQRLSTIPTNQPWGRV